MKRLDQNNDRTPIDGIDSGQEGFFLAQPSSALQEEVPIAESWIALCAKAAVEQDPKKLLDLVIEINRLLDARRKRLADEADGTERK